MTLNPIRATEDRLFKITACTRPFRAVGPRIEAERIGEKLVVHNYGHGGSGWSLSWGSGTVALDLALAGRDPSQPSRARSEPPVRGRPSPALRFRNPPRPSSQRYGSR